METKAEAEITNDNDYGNYNRRGRRGRFERRGNRRIGNRQPREHGESTSSKQEAVILYDSHDNGSKDEKANQDNAADDKKGKSAWWKKLIKG